MRSSMLLSPLLVVVALLAGCGNKGPLVMPPAKPTLVVPVPMAPAPAASAALPAPGQR